jgi:hypothetical protein
VGLLELEVGGKLYLILNTNFTLDLVPGMVLAEEVTAKDDLPPFRASVMVTYFPNNILYKGWLCYKV